MWAHLSQIAAGLPLVQLHSGSAPEHYQEEKDDMLVVVWGRVEEEHLVKDATDIEIALGFDVPNRFVILMLSLQLFSGVKSVDGEYALRAAHSHISRAGVHG
jgi:hypothetical protein